MDFGKLTMISNKKMNKLKILFGALVLATTLNVGVKAAETDIPVEMQASIFLKAIGYNKAITGDTVVIAVVVNPGNNKSVRNKDAFLENINASKSLSTKSISTVTVNAGSLGDIKKQNVDIVYVTRDSDVSGEIARMAKDQKFLTWSAEPEMVKSGVTSISVMSKNNRPKLIVNLKNTKSEGQDISSQLLKLSEIVN